MAVDSGEQIADLVVEVDSIEKLEEWISKEVALRSIWTCPPDKCSAWKERELGYCIGVYKTFGTKWLGWMQKKKRSHKTIKKAVEIGLLEVIHRLMQTCHCLQQKEKASKNLLASRTEESEQQIKGLENQIS